MRRLRDFLGSSLNRLVLAYGAGLLIAFLAVGGVSLIALDHLLDRETRQTVQAEHADLMDVYETQGKNGLIETINARAREPHDVLAIYVLIGSNGEVEAGRRSGFSIRVPQRKGWLRFFRSGDPDAGEVLAYAQSLRDGSWLVTGHATDEQIHLRELTIRLGLVILCLLGALTLLLVWLLRRAVDRSLAASLDTVDRVAAGHLSERVPARDGDDGFARLGQTLNRMLDRIRDLVGGIQSSTDAIAHDLRTPLTRLKTRLEQARLGVADDATRAQIDAAMAEADQLIATFNSLLRLARIEGHTGLPPEPVALDAVLEDAVEMWQALAEARGLEIRTTIAPAAIAGDRDQLFQLLSNLLDNAIKYGTPGTSIDASLHRDGRDVILILSDQGPGIAPDQRERVFDRFVRGESHRGTPGSGLGLSVVKAIAVRHGADLRLESAHPGLRVVLRFPSA
jgi:signal transduction histidine kinase